MEQWRIEKLALVEKYHNENLSALKGQIVFTGSSLMEMFPVDEWAKEDGIIVYNRGVGGYTTIDFLPIVDILVTELSPRKIFINIGTNDLSDPSVAIDEMIARYDEILCRIEHKLPDAIIYMMAYYPINYEAAAPEMKENLRTRTNAKIAEANECVRILAKKHGHKFINVNAPLTDSDGNLKAEYTFEGMHIKPEGYRAIYPLVLNYIME